MTKFGKIRKVLVRGLMVLVVLGCAGWWFENWRGAKAWEEAKARAEAAGVSLVRADYAGPEIPDDENLLLNPVFAEELSKEGAKRLGEWGELVGDDSIIYTNVIDPEAGETVAYCDWFEEELTEQEAQERVSELALDFERRLEKISTVVLSHPRQLLFARADAFDDFSEFGQAATKIDGLRQALYGSSLMALRSGKGEKALRRIEVLDRLRAGLEGPSMLSFIMSVGYLQCELNLIREGIRLRSWNEVQLDRLSLLVEKMDVFSAASASLEFEAAFLIEGCDSIIAGDTQSLAPSNFLEWLLLNGPRGRIERQKALALKGYLQLIEITGSGDQQGFQDFLESFKKDEIRNDSISSLALRMMVSLMESVFIEFGNQLELAKSMLAVEKHFFLNGVYPQDLEDVGVNVSLKGLKYELGPGGRPVISAPLPLLEEEEWRRWQFWSEEE